MTTPLRSLLIHGRRRLRTEFRSPVPMLFLLISASLLIFAGAAPAAARSHDNPYRHDLDRSGRGAWDQIRIRVAASDIPREGPLNDGVYYDDPLKDKYTPRRLAEIRKRLARHLPPRERATLLIEAGHLEMRLQHYRRAIKDFQAATETGVLTRAENAENYKLIGKLYMGMEPPDYDKAIKNLKKSIAISEGRNPSAD